MRIPIYPAILSLLAFLPSLVNAEHDVDWINSLNEQYGELKLQSLQEVSDIANLHSGLAHKLMTVIGETTVAFNSRKERQVGRKTSYEGRKKAAADHAWCQDQVENVVKPTIEMLTTEMKTLGPLWEVVKDLEARRDINPEEKIMLRDMDGRIGDAYYLMGEMYDFLGLMVTGKAKVIGRKEISSPKMKKKYFGDKGDKEEDGDLI